MKLAEKLVYLRKKQGLSQLKLAEMMNVSRQAISRWETGIAVPSAENLKYLGNLYNVSLDYLFNDDVDELEENEKAPEEIEDEIEASDNINLQTGFIDVCATGRFSLDIPAGKIRAAKSSFPLEAGEVVTIKGAYSPFSASVDFGLIAPNGRFYYLNSKDGSLNGAIEVDERGQYTLAIRNNSAETINVSGYVNY